MASTRAEALARYARTKRVNDVTLVRKHQDGEGWDSGFDDWLGPFHEQDRYSLAIDAGYVLRAAILITGCLTMTPALPYLLG
ncbi:hypothetical protein [Thalassococcus lentus]|uniref:Uncharacterized protein n=1 Tax=Thalassococcus lentus TaxID=1210524 RepID=A0ABT4XQH0_9RHOB|nr:hypothetical protein [Thalassococcus lentus]MDA7424197.1 hypothetical protein [Thalassococcus lentus]